MKQAKMKAVLVTVTCPHCGGDQESPSGSYDWEMSEIGELKTHVCDYDDCWKKFSLGAKQARTTA